MNNRNNTNSRNTEKPRGGKPKSTSRSAQRGAPSSAPVISAPRAKRYSANTARYSPSRGSNGPSRGRDGYTKFAPSYATRSISKHAPSSAPRIVPKISTRMAPEYAPKIAQSRVSRTTSSDAFSVIPKNNTSWGNEAEWYDNYLADSDSYQKQIIMPNIVRIIDPKAGKKILDLACGQGLFSESMIDKGANVIGVDISTELITVAKNRFKDKITENDAFIVSPADKMLTAGVLENSCDSAMCILAAQNIAEFDIALKDTAKILKPKGKFVIVLNHPCFRVPKNSDWHFDAEGGGPEGDPSYTIVNGKRAGRYGRVVYSYMSEDIIKIDMHPGEQDRRKKSYTTSFHRPLQVYSKWLANAGFAITRIEEWTSHKKSNPGTRELADKRCKKEIPLFMCIEAVLLD